MDWFKSWTIIGKEWEHSKFWRETAGMKNNIKTGLALPGHLSHDAIGDKSQLKAKESTPYPRAIKTRIL